MVLKKLKSNFNSNNLINDISSFNLTLSRHSGLLSFYFLNQRNTTLLSSRFNKYHYLNNKSLFSYSKQTIFFTFPYNFFEERVNFMYKLYKHVIIYNYTGYNSLFFLKNNIYYSRNTCINLDATYKPRLLKSLVFNEISCFYMSLQYNCFSTIDNYYLSEISSKFVLNFHFNVFKYSNFFFFNVNSFYNYSFLDRFYLNTDVQLVESLHEAEFWLNMDRYINVVTHSFSCSSYFYLFNFIRKFNLFSFEHLYNVFISWLSSCLYRENYSVQSYNFFDLFFKSSVFEKIINFILKKGKREKAENLFFRVLLKVKRRLNVNPFYFFMVVLHNIYYLFDLKKVRAYGKMQTIPVLISFKESFFLSMRLLFSNVRSKKNYLSFEDKLFEILLNCFRKDGSIYDQYRSYVKLCKSNQFLLSYFIK